jgi:ribosomal protein S18 acetylase RimI-like enzyme
MLETLGDEPSPAAVSRTLAQLAKEGRPVLVAQEDEIVGCVSYDLVRPLHHSKPVGRVSLLIIARAARRRGVGTALIREAEARLRAEGCGAVEVVTAIELSNANSFLRGLGYARSGYRFARSLSEA